MNKHFENNKAFAAIVVLVGACGLSFWGGMTYAKSQSEFARNGFAPGTNNMMRGTRGPNMMAGGFAAGTVKSKDATGFTVELRGGPNSANGSSVGSRIIFVDSTTQFGKTVTGTIDDIIVGENVLVSGKSNADGSITAQSVQIRPAGMPVSGAGDRMPRAPQNGTNAPQNQ